MSEHNGQKMILDDLFCLSTTSPLPLSRDLKSLVNNELFADVEIQVTEGHVTPS